MDNNLDFLDMLTIISFIISLENLSLNNEQVNQLQEHLERQDKQYDEIIKLLKERK